jgi:hypothetical protein
MKIVNGIKNIEEVLEKTSLNGKKWELIKSADMISRNVVFDNNIKSWEYQELEVDENGRTEIFVGQDGTYPVKYNSMNFEVFRLDILKIDFQENQFEIYPEFSEYVSRSLEIGIKNGSTVLYFQFNRKNEETKIESYERFYFETDTDGNPNPGGYKSPYISSPSWNMNRDKERLMSIKTYIELLHKSIPNTSLALFKLSLNIKN